MKDLLISNCEKNHVSNCLENNVRVDGRAFQEFRNLKINFGRDWGCCHVSLGETRVLAQVSCEIQQPKLFRPNEGLLNINIELSPMGAPNFEAGRQSNLAVFLNRTLEKCLKDSRAIDLESLCIKSNEKVWAFRIDVNVLNHEGNLIDCASVAALAALAHFKRPDVTTDGETITIHTYEQRDPIPTTLHHYPVCITYAIFNPNNIYIADPMLLEEEVAEAHLTFAINSYKEICCLHMDGNANINLIIECSSKADVRAKAVVEIIRETIKQDEENRQNGVDLFFENVINHFRDVNISREQLNLCLNEWNVKERSKRKNCQRSDESADKILKLGENTVELIGETHRFHDSSDDDNDNDDEEIQIVQVTNVTEKIDIVSSGSSEEDEVVILNPEINVKKNKNKNKKKNK